MKDLPRTVNLGEELYKHACFRSNLLFVWDINVCTCIACTINEIKYVKTNLGAYMEN